MMNCLGVMPPSNGNLLLSIFWGHFSVHFAGKL
uniref:Uncharacterized protein n=1 Tax=Rhizophora mucronata TaxID=61149 RepID=A0A2P2QNZ6_RHIMU